LCLQHRVISNYSHTFLCHIQKYVNSNRKQFFKIKKQKSITLLLLKNINKFSANIKIILMHFAAFDAIVVYAFLVVHVIVDAINSEHAF